MADNDTSQKTEEATPRRRSEAREKGQVAISTELIAGLGLCGGMGAFVFAGGRLMRASAEVMTDTVEHLGSLGTGELTIPLATGLVREGTLKALGALMFIILPALMLAALVGYGQVGFRVATKAVEPSLEKVSPLKGLKRLFGMRALVRTLLAAAKVSLISLTVLWVAWSQLAGVSRLGASELGPLLKGLGTVALRCSVAGLVVVLALGVIDFAFQRFQHTRDLRMSKQEVREEHRLTEGDPQIKARVRQLQREMASRRMMQEVPEATVVVTNPTHYAVALKYEYDESGTPIQAAPLVVAKGVDHLAQRIKQVASEAEVHCYEDVPLARALYAQAEIGQEIPEDLYGAVATVIGYVLRLRGEDVAAPTAEAVA